MLIGQDQDESAILSQALQRASLRVLTAHDVSQALLIWRRAPADLIILIDSGESPIEFVERLRASISVPVVLLTDSLREDEHMALLEAGADLVYFRPYSVRLLVSQIPVLLRRVSGVPLSVLPSLEDSGLRLEPTTRVVEVGDQQPRQLSHLEFRLLYTLMAEPGRAFSTEELVERVWGYDGEGDRDLVRKLVHRLRLKVEANPSQPRYILSVSGVGYAYSAHGEEHKMSDTLPHD